MLQQGIIALPFDQPVGGTDPLGVNMDQATGDIGYFKIPFRCEVVEAGGIVTATCAGGTSTPVVDFESRPVAGSDANRGSADIGHLILGTTPGGKVMYDQVARGTILVPGMEIVVKLTIAAVGGGKAGHIRPYIVVVPRDETKANLANMVMTP
jgi:hypothetical protein